MKNPGVIAITGASSGLGAALSRYYAGPGKALYLLGRNEERLKMVTEECRALGAVASMACGDVTDASFMAQWVAHAGQAAGLDLLIANAGVSAGTGIHGETQDQAQHIFAVNVTGTLNTVLPALPAMMERRRGQIAIMSSIAAMRGLPSAPAYSASKAAIKAYGEALRGWLMPRGVEVSVICPGYIRTPMTAVNGFPMPFIMEPEKAAALIAKGLARNRARIAFPLPFYLAAWFAGCLSPTLTDPLFSRLPAKPASVF